MFSRRRFLQSSAIAAGLAALPPRLRAATAPRGFSFVFLGDLHFDRLEHHDLAWVRKDKPNDVVQIEDYSRITREVMPAFFATLRAVVADLNRSPATPAAFVVQAGDFVEGLCGNEELSARQNREALAFVRDARLGVPFLFTKGNHDITGPGAAAAFANVFHPFLTGQTRALAPEAPEVKSARYTVDCGNAQFVFCDAYERESLDWLEAVAARRTAEHFFVVVHPPVVPYGARSTWHLYSGAKDQARRERLLKVLGAQRAIVLGGHIHRYNRLVRETAGGGRFTQFALSSVVSRPKVTAKDMLLDVAEYTPDQVRVEPRFSPETEPARRAVYETERAFVRAFEYADVPGYAVVTVDGPRVSAAVFPGTSRQPWRTVNLNPPASAPV
jgi:hypothetical protein